MKRYIVTSRKTQREHELNEDELEMLRSRVNIQRKYTVREIPARKPVPRPDELRVEDNPKPSRVIEPKSKKND